MASSELFSPEPPARLVDRPEIARQIGCSIRTVLNYEDEGMPVIRQGRKRLYDLKRVRAWFERGTGSRRRSAR